MFDSQDITPIYLLLVNAIDLHYRYEIKISLCACTHLELQETENITYLLLLKAHPH